MAGVLIICALAIISLYTSISGLIKAEMFPVEVRALGVGVSYAVANALFGGSAEYVALWFKQAGHGTEFLLVRQRHVRAGLHRRRQDAGSDQIRAAQRLTSAACRCA
jgi:hypothetical protein